MCLARLLKLDTLLYLLYYELLVLYTVAMLLFLNQARAWFLKIDPVRIVCMCVCLRVCVCPPPRLLITSGVMWCDIDSRRLVKQVL